MGPVEPAAKTLPIATDDNEDSDSDQSATPLPKASPLTATPAATARSSTTGEVPAPTPPGDRVDALNRPWPPCDDQELVNYKLDNKAGPSWKTIGQECIAQLKAVVLVGSG